MGCTPEHRDPERGEDDEQTEVTAADERGEAAVGDAIGGLQRGAFRQRWRRPRTRARLHLAVSARNVEWTLEQIFRVAVEFVAAASRWRRRAEKARPLLGPDDDLLPANPRRIVRVAVGNPAASGGARA